MLVVLSLFFVVNRYTYTFGSLAKAEPLTESVESPDKNQTARVYWKPVGGATGHAEIFVEVSFAKTGQTKIVYHSTGKDIVEIKWKNNEILDIKNESAGEGNNRSKSLNVFEEIYDENGAACRSVVLNLKSYYETCYKN
ncbi:DUF5412 domain-containing protein [Saccharibacillus sp. JS10]|nr:DUF5412 domain-containing protein [Saccharibacillus sp. JS10]